MGIKLGEPAVDELGDVVVALRSWQVDGAPVQLHPGDVGWQWRLGPRATAAALRTWRRTTGRLLAVGFLDGPGLLRLALDPEVSDDPTLAGTVATDLALPDRLLPAGTANVEVPASTAVAEHLRAEGLADGEPWTPLRRDLTEPVEDPGLRVDSIGPERAREYVEVHRASFDVSRFSVEQWHAMAAGDPFKDARCLLAYDDAGTAVAATTVWSAGAGRPGLIEPLGAHRGHRGHGHGRAIAVAAAAALRELGASSILVKTPADNAAGVAAYRSAGLVPDPPAPDLVRR